MQKDSWITPSGTSTQAPFARHVRRREPKKGADIHEPTDHALGLSKGGLGTKLHLVVETHGLPLSFTLSPGQANERLYVAPLLLQAQAVRKTRELPTRLAADRGYVSWPLREWLIEQGIKPVIPPKRNQRSYLWRASDKKHYRKRNVIERCVGRLKNFRRIGTRYEKLALNFGAMITLAMCVLYLRAL